MKLIIYKYIFIVCLLKFDTNLRYGCKTFDWRPRFFYNQTSAKCEMFWYDASCSKHREVINMFYHRGACKRLCEQSEQMVIVKISSVNVSFHLEIVFFFYCTDKILIKMK